MIRRIASSVVSAGEKFSKLKLHMTTPVVANGPLSC